MAEYAAPFEDDTRPSRTGSSSQGFSWPWVFRVIGAILIVGATAGIWFGMAPETSGNDFVSQIENVMANETSNQELTEGAPQQTVVNGWVARDLLEIIARQGAAGPAQDERPAALIAVAVLGLAVGLATTRRV